jgi:hypothetical protein
MIKTMTAPVSFQHMPAYTNICCYNICFKLHKFVFTNAHACYCRHHDDLVNRYGIYVSQMIIDMPYLP